jgi:hypothetical protein
MPLICRKNSDTAAFIGASTLDLPDTAFMSGGTLTGSPDAKVVNLGTISSSGGDILLTAHYGVANAGSVSAPKGTAEYASRHQVVLFGIVEQQARIGADRPQRHRRRSRYHASGAHQSPSGRRQYLYARRHRLANPRDRHGRARRPYLAGCRRWSCHAPTDHCGKERRYTRQHP